MQLSDALGLLLENAVIQRDKRLEETALCVRSEMERRDGSLKEVMAQIHRDDSGHFFVPAEAEEILRKAANKADVPWKYIAPQD
jgi:hypothetical protein